MRYNWNQNAMRFIVQSPPRRISKSTMIMDLLLEIEGWTLYNHHFDDKIVYFLPDEEIIKDIKKELDFCELKEEYDKFLLNIDDLKQNEDKSVEVSFNHPFLKVLFSYVIYIQELWYQRIKIEYFNSELNLYQIPKIFTKYSMFFNEIVDLWEQYALVPIIEYQYHPSFMMYAAMQQDFMSLLYRKLHNSPAKCVLLLCYLYDFGITGKKGYYDHSKSKEGLELEALIYTYFLNPIEEFQHLSKNTINETIIKLKKTDWSFNKKIILYFLSDLSKFSMKDLLDVFNDFDNNFNNEEILESNFYYLFTNDIQWDDFQDSCLQSILCNITIFSAILNMNNKDKFFKNWDINNIYANLIKIIQNINKFKNINKKEKNLDNNSHLNYHSYQRSEIEPLIYIPIEPEKVIKDFHEIYESFKFNMRELFKDSKNRFNYWSYRNDFPNLYDKIEFTLTKLLNYFKNSKLISKYLLNERERMKSEEIDMDNDDYNFDEDECYDFSDDNGYKIEHDIRFYGIEDINSILWSFNNDFIKVYYNFIDDIILEDDFEQYLLYKATEEEVFILFSLYIEYDVHTDYNYNFVRVAKYIKHLSGKPSIKENYLKFFIIPVYNKLEKFCSNNVTKNEKIIQLQRYQKIWQYLIRLGIKKNLLMEFFEYLENIRKNEILNEILKKAYTLVDEFSDLSSFPKEEQEYALKNLIYHIFQYER